MRETKQKQMIREELSRFKSFFNAEQLHQKVLKKNKRAGIATIYRFLNNSVRAGEIHSYTCNRRTIYSTSRSNHCHFICKTCGEIKHIDMKKLDFLSKQVEGEIYHIQIDVTGICRDCKK